jgi:hypothetical protein
MSSDAAPQREVIVMNRDSGSTRYSDEAVRQILARAQYLERSEGIDRIELLEIAREVGVSQAAVATAMEAYDATGPTSASAQQHLPSAVVRHFGIGLGFSMAFAAPTLMLGTTPLLVEPFAGVAALMLSGVLAARSDKEARARPVRRFLAQNLGLWIGVGLGSVGMAAIAVGFPLDHVTRVVITKTAVFLWAMSSAVGAAVVALRPRHVAGPGVSSTVLGRLRRSAAQTLRSWADRIAQRTRATRVDITTGASSRL